MKKIRSFFKHATAWMLFIVISFGAVPCLSLPLSATDGEISSDAVPISSVDELAKIGGEYPLDGYYYLTCDIDMSESVGENGAYYNGGSGWSPIGTSDAPFTGTFNGNGYTIIALASNNKAAGLFGYIADAVIKDLTLDNVSVSSDTYAGGIAAYSTDSDIYRCVVTGEEIFSYNTAGGIVACISGGSISLSENSAKIDTSGFCSYAGGIAGYATNNAVISDCTNNAGVIALGEPEIGMANSNNHAGGIVGRGRNTQIIRCENYGTISMEYGFNGFFGNCSIFYTGGIVGALDGETNSISMSYNGSSTLLGETNSGCIGAIVGYVYHFAAVTIENCYSVDCQNLLVGKSYTSKYSSSEGNAVTTLKNCYNIGAGITENGTAINCYYTSDAETGIGTFCSDEQMKTQVTFEGWDFVSVWTMAGSKNHPYPDLISAGSSLQKILISVSIETLPSKLSYTEGVDSLDATGGMLSLLYSDNSTESVPITSDMVYGFDNTKAGDQLLTVTYKSCSDTFSVSVLHNYTKEVFEPTCTKQGYTLYSCACGHSYTDSHTDMIPHILKTDSKLDPTCTETGLTEGSHCSECGLVKEAQWIIPAKGHSYENRLCTECGERDPEAPDHVPGDVNGDGKIDTKDLTRLMKFISGDNVTIYVSDVSGDGSVNTKDLTRLMKYLAGDDVVIF